MPTKLSLAAFVLEAELTRSVISIKLAWIATRMLDCELSRSGKILRVAPNFIMYVGCLALLLPSS